MALMEKKPLKLSKKPKKKLYISISKKSPKFNEKTKKKTKEVN